MQPSKSSYAGSEKNSLICCRHVGNMSPTCAYVAKSWPTLRVVATQKRPRHTQFISIITDKYKSAQTYRYLAIIEFLCLSSNNNHEITDMSGIPRHVVKCRVVLDTLPTRHFLVYATWLKHVGDMSPTRHRMSPFGQQKDTPTSDIWS